MRRSVGTALVAFCAAATAGVTALATAPAATAAAPHRARAHYVDCRSGTGPERGTRTAPWRTLAAVNAQRLGPGDQVLLKRGTRCTGTLAPNGAGA
ncbi:right-handed parallel beta-helix repeat-containing protein, partial [Streptomyces sp. NPDC056121]